MRISSKINKCQNFMMSSWEPEKKLERNRHSNLITVRKFDALYAV